MPIGKLSRTTNVKTLAMIEILGKNKTCAYGHVHWGGCYYKLLMIRGFFTLNSCNQEVLQLATRPLSTEIERLRRNLKLITCSTFGP